MVLDSPDWYRHKREKVEKLFTDENRAKEEPQVVTSPSGRFTLTVQRYITGPNKWDYTSGIVTRVGDDAPVATIHRNFGHFWHSWVEQAGQGYLLCGEDNQGYCVIDLNRAKVHTCIPSDNCRGFCWVNAVPSPDARSLAVEGCYWAGPYQVRVYDFSDSTALPLPLLKNLGADESIVESDFTRWIDANTLEVKVTRERDGQEVMTTETLQVGSDK